MSVLLGMLAGAHASSWGMYKDAPHEGFTFLKYSRSIIVAALIAVVLHRVTGMDLSNWGQAAVFFGMVYALERLGTSCGRATSARKTSPSTSSPCSSG